MPDEFARLNFQRRQHRAGGGDPLALKLVDRIVRHFRRDEMRHRIPDRHPVQPAAIRCQSRQFPGGQPEARHAGVDVQDSLAAVLPSVDLVQ